MSQALFDELPKIILAREFKINGRIFVTTLRDPKRFTKKELARLYKKRWQIEVDLNSIKTVLGMDILSCKTPSMVNKELSMHFLSYNIIRSIMFEAGLEHAIEVHTISFKGAIQYTNAFIPYLAISSKTNCKKLFSKMLSYIKSKRVGNRSGRVEPRAVKRRPKAYPLLHGCRQALIEMLIKCRSKKYSLSV